MDASGSHQRGAPRKTPDIHSQLKRSDTYSKLKMSDFQDTPIYPQVMASDRATTATVADEGLSTSGASGTVSNGGGDRE